MVVSVVRRTVGVAAALACGAAAVSCTPPPPSPLPACPARQEVQLEPADPVDFSLPRAVSPEGGWVAASRVVGGDVVVSVRPATAGAPAQTVGSLPYSELSIEPPLVAVTGDASHVLFAVESRAALPTQTPTELFRWDRATGSVTSATPPTAAAPPPGVPYPVNIRALSADGSRAVWTQTFYEAPSTFRQVLTVTDTVTDAVVSQTSALPTGAANGTLSSGGRTLTVFVGGQGYLVVDIDAATATPLGDAQAAAGAAYPGTSGFTPVTSSDDGRYTVLHRPDDPGDPPTTVLWDAAASTITLVHRGAPTEVAAVGDDGSVLFSVPSSTGPERVASLRRVDGTVVPVATAAMSAAWAEGAPARPLASDDLRTVVYSEPVPLLGNRLVARRCA